ncbi:biogenesis protein MshI [Marinobacteraceae bacterium S3BR75-40.1]
MKFPALFNIFGRQGRAQPIGLEVRPDGLAWALRPASGHLQTGFAECMPAKRAGTLEATVEEYGLKGAPVRAVLSNDQYQVFQIDRPPVEDSELADAVRWKLKDMIDYSVDEAAVDVFPFPDDASRGRGELINAVVCRKAIVRDLIKLCDSAGLTLDRVGISELSLRNLIAPTDEENRGTALMYLRAQHGQLVVCRGDTLYLARRLEVTANQLSDASQQDTAIQNLALEIQRSMDYYESQLGQVPPRTVYLVGHDENLPLTHLISSNVAAQVENYDWREWLGMESLESRAIDALGAIVTFPGGTA